MFIPPEKLQTRSSGDCELLVLRRVKGARAPYELVCHTEMQRIDGHAQTPLQLARDLAEEFRMSGGGR